LFKENRIHRIQIYRFGSIQRCSDLSCGVLGVGEEGGGAEGVHPVVVPQRVQQVLKRHCVTRTSWQVLRQYKHTVVPVSRSLPDPH
jgi:hypothetical protein